MKIPICKAKFVGAYDLFRRLPTVWNVLVNSDPDFSWGNNNRTLVTAEFIVQHLEQVCDTKKLERSLDILKARIERLPGKYQCYVDLEN